MRRSGILIPLFSCSSTRGWGIGDIGDVDAMTKWLSAAGQSALQLLPLNEMAAGQQSPYSATSAMAIDPIFIDMSDVADFTALGGVSSLSHADRTSLADVRNLSYIDYGTVRGLKVTAFAAAFDRFYEVEWRGHSERAQSLEAFVEREAWWVEDYALFRAIHARESDRAWPDWPAGLKDRDRAALDGARQELARERLYYQYLQWIADSQWKQARAAARANGVRLLGDLPFMVDGDSADVWLHQNDFFLDVSVGVPPDAFSATGQDWGMPTYHWEAVTADNLSWLRERARRSAAFYTGYRVDHLVGFYRTFGRPRDGSPAFFNPSDEAAQVALGERVLAIMSEPGSEIIAEDLGIVPDCVRHSLARLGVPGFRVFRWERVWHEEGQPFRNPAEYPTSSVATTGTHDTEPLATWWDQLSPEDRRKVAAVPGIQQIAGGTNLDGAFDARIRDVLLEALFASGSELLLLPIQDVFGWRDRVNEPATVKSENWTFRLPWPVDRLDEIQEARERQQALLGWSKRYMR